MGDTSMNLPKYSKFGAEHADMACDLCDDGLWSLAGVPMSNQDQLRNRSSRLLAMAMNARNEGHLDYAERFTQRASEILNHSTTLERLGTQGRSHAGTVRSRLHRKRG
jgi:hypothetical protein